MIRLIAIDLDGTLLTSNRQIHPKNAEAIAEAIRSGVAICLASGRALQTMRPFAQQLGLIGPIVSCNGACVVGWLGEEIKNVALPQDATDTILDYACRKNIHTNCYVGESIGFSQIGKWSRLYEERTGCSGQLMSLSEMRTKSASKLLFIDNPSNIENYTSEMSELLAPLNISVITSEPDYVEFLPPGVNKKSGLQALADSAGLNRDEIAAIGDWVNDLEMVSWAGWGAAVANAHPLVKKAAITLLSSNDEAGVSEFIALVLNDVKKV